MFRSRQTIAFSIIVLYFIPILFLSLYSVNSGPNHTWTLFSFGLFFGIAGTLVLFLLMIQFETAVSSSRIDDDENRDLQHSLFEDDQPHLDFDAIIVNLNAELDLKKRESEKLGKENLELMSRLEEMVARSQMQNRIIEIEEREKELVPIVPAVKPLSSSSSAKNPSFENYALDIEKIEQSLYGKDNRVEVTRL